MMALKVRTGGSEESGIINADDRFTFDIEKYLRHDLKLRGNEVYQVIEVDV
jgi:hypothetical protein